jgi:Alcohol dehydrogenase, class IV
MAERINAVKTSFFGIGAIRLLGPELQKMGIRRALLVTDRFLYDSGAAARVGQVLSDAGVEYAVYYNVQPNPTVQVVNDCIAADRTLQVQLLVGLGGGKAIDTAKADSIVVDLRRYRGNSTKGEEPSSSQGPRGLGPNPVDRG